VAAAARAVTAFRGRQGRVAAGDHQVGQPCVFIERTGAGHSAEDTRVLFGFWRGKRLQAIEPRLKRGGKYEMATMEIVEKTRLGPATIVALVRQAVALNDRHGDPTDLKSAATGGAA
jgi:hypothetical protein